MIHLLYRYCTIVGICEEHKRFQNKMYRIPNINKYAQPFQINLDNLVYFWFFVLLLDSQEVYKNVFSTNTNDCLYKTHITSNK